MGPINNACNQPLFTKSGTVPDVSGALQDYYQPMTFQALNKMVNGFQVVESGAAINFQGMIQPLTDRQLIMKPEGQRAWTWFLLFADPVLKLKVDDVVIWNGVQTRVMALKDNSLFGFMEYHLCQDWQGSGP